MSAELKEALAVFESEPEYRQRAYAPIVEAARRVAEADEVWWCEVHRLSAFGGVHDRCAYMELLKFRSTGARPCRMVKGRLLLPAEEES